MPSFIEETLIAPFSSHFELRVRTMLALPGSGFPILSHVFHPIIKGQPIVMSFSLLKSSDIFQKSCSPSPITLFFADATIALIVIFDIIKLQLFQKYADVDYSLLSQNHHKCNFQYCLFY